MDADHRPTIVHIVTALAPGGMERVLVHMLHEWNVDRLRHVVVTLRAAGPLAQRLPDYTACRALNITGRSRSAWWSLAGVLRRLRPDVIHARGAGAWCDTILASMLEPCARVILGFHGWDGLNPVSRETKWAARLARRSGAQFLTVSHSARVRLAGEIGLDAEEIGVIPNGVDTQLFRPCDPQTKFQQRHDLGLSPTDLAVGVVGSLTSIKRHDVALDAFARVAVNHSALVLLIAGDGPLRGALQARAATLGMDRRVRFLGWRDDLPSMLPALDAYVCASDSEGQSNALLEALACGLPVVTTNVGDHAALVGQHDSGFVVPCSDPSALAAALCRLCADDRNRKDMGIRARQTVEPLSFSGMADRYESLYQSLVPGMVPAQESPREPHRTLVCVP